MQSHARRRAELARHRASDLARHAKRHALFGRDDHRLDFFGIVEPYQQFSRAVGRARYKRRHRMPDREVLLQVVAQRSRQIAHLVERFGAARVHPMQDLARAIRALARARDQLLDFIERQVAEIGARSAPAQPRSGDCRSQPDYSNRNAAVKAGRSFSGENFARREEKRDFLRRRLGRVGAMRRVLLDVDAEVLANRARVRLFGIGRAHQLTPLADRALRLAAPARPPGPKSCTCTGRRRTAAPCARRKTFRRRRATDESCASPRSSAPTLRFV